MKVDPVAGHAYSISNVDVQVALGREDSNNQHHVMLANQAKELLIQAFKLRGLHDIEKETVSTRSVTDENLTLHIKITRCSDGSRMGRSCWSAFGVGWALLFLEWCLRDDSSETTVLGPVTDKFRDSGVFGFVDLCDDLAGDHAVQQMAAFKAPSSIDKKISEALPQGTV